MNGYVHELKPDVIHAQHLGFGLSLAFSRAEHDIPIIAVAHGTDVISAMESRQALETLREIIERSEQVIFPTTSLLEHVEVLTRSTYSKKFSVASWGIPLNRTARQHQPGSSPRLKLLHAGRLDSNKDTITAVESLAYCQYDHRLTIIGSGPEEDRLRSKIEALGIASQVDMVPFCTRERLWNRFADHDAFILTTRDLEAFGLVGVEAQAHGLPVIYSAVAGMTHTLGSRGLSFEPGNPRALAKAIDTFAIKPKLRHKLSRHGLSNAQRYDISHIADHFRDTSESAIDTVNATT